MAIRGIDTQIMMNRLTDNVKEASELLKRPEVVQDLLGNRGRINDAQEQQRVAKMSETAMESIRADVDGGSSNEYEETGGEKHNAEQENTEAPQEFYVPAERHYVDIKI